MSCIEAGESAEETSRSYRRTGPATVLRRRLPILEVLMLGLSLTLCLAVMTGIVG